MEYRNLEQLIISRYEITRAPFHADVQGGASVESQRAFYGLIGDAYAALMGDPGLMFVALHPYDVYRNRYNMSSEKKPELYGKMKHIIAGVDGFIVAMMLIAQVGERDGDALRVSREHKLKKSHIRVLEALGITCVTGKSEYIFALGDRAAAMEAWRWMAVREGANVLQFSRCMFDSAHSYIKDVYREALGDREAFDRLADFLETHGYQRIEMRGGEFLLDYAKEYGEKPSPLKAGWAERTHGGVACEYQFTVEKPFACVLRIPMNKAILERAEDMEPSLREFVISRNKKCDNCRYCVQTDKTGARPLAYIPVEHDGKRHALCPRFPGFQFTFEKLNDDIVRNMIAYLKFIDRVCG